MSKQRQEYFAFLSTNYNERMIPLRKAIVALGENAGRRVWAESLAGSSEDILDECLRMIRESERFICILDGDYGGTTRDSSWLLLNGVSVIELEIFQAVLCGKPLSVFVLDPENLDRRLESLFQVLEQVNPAFTVRASGLNRILSDVARILESRTGIFRSTLDGIRIGTEAFRFLLARERSPLISGNRTMLDVRFLGGQIPKFRPREKADPEAVQDLLRQAKGASGERASSYQLSRLWSAARLLSSAPPEDRKNAEYLPMWWELLSLWSGVVGWRGLHGHVSLGRLAAVNTAIDVKRIASEFGVARQLEPSIQGSRAAAASEYYTLARLVASGEPRRRFLEAGLVLVNESLRSNEADMTHILAIRGALLSQSGNREQALDDLRTVLTQRAARGYSPGQVGEAEAEAEAEAALGYSLVRMGKRKKGLSLIKEGVQKLENTNNPAFTAQAMMKLGHASLLLGRFFAAWEAFREAHAIMDRYDLIRPGGGATEMLSRFVGGLNGRRSQ